MKFRYLRGSGGISRPALDVVIAGPSARLDLKMLVDSGSDWTMIPLGMFRALGIATEAEVPLAGVGGSRLGLLGTARFQCSVGGWTGKLVGADLSSDFPPVLGQRDFFGNFLVGFDGRQSAFYVETAPSP